MRFDPPIPNKHLSILKIDAHNFRVLDLTKDKTVMTGTRDECIEFKNTYGDN